MSLKRLFAMTSVFSWYNSVNLFPVSFCTQGQTYLLFRYVLTSFFVFESCMMKKTPCVCVCVCVCVRVHTHAGSVVSDSLQPHGLLPTRLLCPWDYPGKNNGGGCHFLLQGIFPTQELNLSFLRLLHWQVDSLPLSHLGRH